MAFNFFLPVFQARADCRVACLFSRRLGFMRLHSQTQRGGCGGQVTKLYEICAWLYVSCFGWLLFRCTSCRQLVVGMPSPVHLSAATGPPCATRVPFLRAEVTHTSRPRPRTALSRGCYQPQEPGCRGHAAESGIYSSAAWSGASGTRPRLRCSPL